MEYLAESQTIAFLIQWGGLFVFLFLVLLPFFVVSLRRFRPRKLWHIFILYVTSFLIFVLIEYLSNVFHELLGNYHTNYGWIVSAWIKASGIAWFLLLFIWPISIFYSAGLLYGKLSTKQKYTAGLVAGFTFLLLLFIFLLLITYGLGQIFN